MRITQIMLSKGWGGAERIFIDLVKGLAEQGIQVQVIMDRRFQQKKRLEGIDNIHPSFIRPLSHIDFIAAANLCKKMQRFSPDVVHCHLSRGALMGGRAAAKLSLPAVVTTHNNIKLKYCRNINYFIVLTEAQRDYLKGQGVSGEAIVKIPNFSNFQPTAEIKKSTNPIFVAYGRMVPKKGFIDLIHAFHLIAEKQPDAKLLIGGEGVGRNELQNWLLELGLQHQVSFVGWVEDVKQHLDRGAVFVLPSRDEPFGIVLLEVMACAVPIVTTKTTGACEILSDETAFFADVGDPVSLSDAMALALQSPERWQKAEAALALFNRHYRKGNVIPTTIEYYQNILAG
ncbi:MAG: glycosyltransferase family 4 protein [Gammaproteobacteria bacterium]|nr:glycosyltransferase family 4 protein [Gammaproteobacteria bacterium]MCF6230112.1 glycosyltransferase family 4 protein [Gammaproteobacteria bacterium]